MDGTKKKSRWQYKEGCLTESETDLQTNSSCVVHSAGHENPCSFANQTFQLVLMSLKRANIKGKSTALP